MLTSYTLRRQAEEAREAADSSVARAPDPAPAVAPDPAPARAPTVEELLAALDDANEERTTLRDELSRAEAMFTALPEQMAAKIEETVGARLADAKAAHDAELLERDHANEHLRAQLADARTTIASLGEQLTTARAAITVLEAQLATSAGADAPSVPDAPSSDEPAMDDTVVPSDAPSAPTRRRRQ